MKKTAWLFNVEIIIVQLQTHALKNSHILSKTSVCFSNVLSFCRTQCTYTVYANRSVCEEIFSAQNSFGQLQSLLKRNKRFIIGVFLRRKTFVLYQDNSRLFQCRCLLCLTTVWLIKKRYYLPKIRKVLHYRFMMFWFSFWKTRLHDDNLKYSMKASPLARTQISLDLPSKTSRKC